MTNRAGDGTFATKEAAILSIAERVAEELRCVYCDESIFDVDDAVDQINAMIELGHGDLNEPTSIIDQLSYHGDACGHCQHVLDSD